jgi:hypothetical protein
MTVGIDSVTSILVKERHSQNSCPDSTSAALIRYVTHQVDPHLFDRLTVVVRTTSGALRWNSRLTVSCSSAAVLDAEAAS